VDETPTPARESQDGARAQALGADFSRLSAIELGARRGIGPLSSRGEFVWHGGARPCVSCGQLITRTAGRCDHCGQLLSGNMLHRMRQHSGPWYVLEHVRPFPGVSKERLILQIRRGLLSQTTIIRGPSTHHQWRFAGETPGLSKYLGVCWACQAEVHEDDPTCPVCRANLDSDGEEVLIEGDETLRPPAHELDELKVAIRSAAAQSRTAPPRAPGTHLPARWIVAAMIVLAMAVVWLLVKSRGDRPARPPGGGADQVPLVLPTEDESDNAERAADAADPGPADES
jgi:hypothetical protein